MPMLTTVSIRLPVTPVQAPLRTLLGEGVDLVQHLVHLRDDVRAVDDEARVRRGGRRSAVCSTDRSSVTLICSPANIAARRSATPDLLGQLEQPGQHVVVDQVLGEVDVQVAGGEAVALRARSGSASNQPRRSGVEPRPSAR